VTGKGGGRRGERAGRDEWKNGKCTDMVTRRYKTKKKTWEEREAEIT